MMLKLLIIFSLCVQVYLFAEINNNNCINGANFTTECRYNINFNNIGNANLHCILNFTLSNPTVKFSNNWIKVKKEEDNKCPVFDLNIITVDNGTTKDKKLSTTCGGEIEKIERNFSNVSLVVIKLDSTGLHDQVSIVDMSLEIDGDCKEIVERRYNTTLIIVVILSIIAIIIFTVYKCNGTRKHRAAVAKTREYSVAFKETNAMGKSICWCYSRKRNCESVKEKSISENNISKQTNDEIEDGKQRDSLV